MGPAFLVPSWNWIFVIAMKKYATQACQLIFCLLFEGVIDFSGVYFLLKIHKIFLIKYFFPAIPPLQGTLARLLNSLQ